MCHPETTSQSECGFRDGFSAWAAVRKARPTLRCRSVCLTPAPCIEFDSPRFGACVEAGQGQPELNRHRIDIGLIVCAENPRICFANPHRLRPPAGVLARGLKTLTRFLYARALHRVRFSAGGGDPSARDTAGCHPVGIESISSRGFARRIRVFASQIRTGFGRLPASSPARYKRFAFA